MVTLELVEAELERLNVDDLSKVYRYIKQVEHSETESAAESDDLLVKDWGYTGDDEAWMRLWLGR